MREATRLHERNHNFDDPFYVTENSRVQNGVTIAGIVWALTTGHFFNRHPATWISPMLDVQLPLPALGLLSLFVMTWLQVGYRAYNIVGNHARASADLKEAARFGNEAARVLLKNQGGTR